MGRRAVVEATHKCLKSLLMMNGEVSAEVRAQPTSAQKLLASQASAAEVAPDPFGREAKHSEIRTLNRDVGSYIVLEGVDKSVVEVVSGDCIIVADDSQPYGSPLAERRVKVSMEYSRKVSMADGPNTTGIPGSADSRVMDFGSVFLSAPKTDGEDSTSTTPSASAES
ncbi:hypothetical protein HPP92_006780 [Vanilla planifolia]|uniref:Uncharacterized protein n=1 Tax=Vanilla planifolia TaxID=51239 RepID=A0A835RQ11_VANPL|nr:hypothetical protein HPP92_007036 [Vanilla planifolia]KAG0489917.1 hypothetical protein HPP92_006780 [Vanilla planifolia]